MCEVQHARGRCERKPLTVASSGGALFVHRFRVALSAHEHLLLFMFDGVVAQSSQGPAYRAKWA